MDVKNNPPVRADVAAFAIVPLHRKIVIKDTDPENGRTCKTVVHRMSEQHVELSHRDWHRYRTAVTVDLKGGTAQLHQTFFGDLRWTEVSTRVIVDACRRHLLHRAED